MIRFSYELDCGVVLSLADLKTLLEKMSQGHHQWVAVPVPHSIPSGKSVRDYVAIGYTNPVGPRKHNYISFLFPLVRPRDVPNTGTNMQVCLHPQCASPLSQGLYLEEGVAKRDMLGDWERFWSPLSEAMVPGRRSGQYEAGFQNQG
jgi:hypothetical protein